MVLVHLQKATIHFWYFHNYFFQYIHTLYMINLMGPGFISYYWWYIKMSNSYILLLVMIGLCVVCFVLILSVLQVRWLGPQLLVLGYFQTCFHQHLDRFILSFSFLLHMNMLFIYIHLFCLYSCSCQLSL